jgi:uncharacterized protein (TIGR02145 family)
MKFSKFSALVVILVFVGCENIAQPRYLITSSPIVPVGNGLCVAVDPKDPQGVWWWDIGRSGCSSRSSTITHAEGASVVASGSDRPIVVRFRVGLISRSPGAYRDVHIAIDGGKATLLDASESAQVELERRKDLDLSEEPCPCPGSRPMADGKQWTVNNLNVNIGSSFCYGDAEPNCRRYGRLYTWESARRACQSLGDAWRLPTSDEWKQMAKHYGGIRDDSGDGGRAAFTALLSGGSAGFNALLGGNRSVDGNYERSQAHGLYWTASETGPGSAIFYNFGQGGQALNRQNEGEKQMAMSVRCVRD